MTCRPARPRPRSMSAGQRCCESIVTLLMFLVVFIAFLIAPLIALGAGFLVYVVWRSRGEPAVVRRAALTSARTSATGFGAGAS